MLSKQEIQHIANLARLHLSEEELERYGRDLSLILDYVAQLQELDVADVRPTSHSVEVENVTRKDIARKESPARVNALLEAAPKKERGYISTKAIL